MMKNPFLWTIVSGVLLGFSFPNFSFWFLAYFFLVPLFFISERYNYKITFLSGVIAGLIGYTIILYWIYPTVVENTNSVVQGFISIFLLACYLSLYLAIFLVLHKFIFFLLHIPILSPIVSSALWVSLEYLRTHLFTGFPWAVIGYSQWNNLVVSQISDLTGVYGVSFFVVCVNITIYQLLKNVRALKKASAETASTEKIIEDTVGLRKHEVPNIILIFFVLIYGIVKLFSEPGHYSADTAASHNYLKIAVIQPNIDQYKKWDKNYYIEVTKKIKALVIHTAKSFGPEVILWPETAVPDITTSPQIHSWLKDAVVESSRFNLVGGFFQKEGKVYNSAFLLSPAGEMRYIHKKTHLVPFGEFVPFRKFLEPYFEVFNFMGDLKRGTGYTTMSVNDKRFSALICSENLFPDIVRRFVRNGAKAVVVITNDAWFGRTSAAFQHFTFNVFRAIENRRFVVQSANTGVSGVVSPSGKILKATEIFKDAHFSFDVSLMSEKTFYTEFGDIFANGCFMLSVFTIGKGIWKNNLKRSGQSQS